MQTATQYVITTLPALGELGTSPAMGLADLLEHVAEIGAWRDQVSAVALMDDLLQRDAMAAGEIEEAEPAVLTISQVRGEAPLPEAIATPPEEESTSVVEADLLWDRYFRHVHDLGRRRRSRFLVKWAEYEVSLRNALAAARAARLGLEESGYLVASDLADSLYDFSAVINEWEGAATPLDGLRVILRSRWAWTGEHEAWYSFGVDELLVYAVRVMLLEQWERSTDQEEQTG